MKILERSYQRQAESENGMALPTRYTDPGSVDNWRHTRMLDLAGSLVRALPGARWLTVGDGRYGSDAAYLFQKGVDVIATSLTDERLKIAREKGFIGKFQAENAEKISLADDAVDFVLCKESYHHFPRPPVALYEMLRVARQGVVLIEPIDNPRPLDLMKSVLKRVLRGDREMQFEPSGNFLYRLNVRELGKLLAAMGGEVMAFKGINDFYHPRFARHRAADLNLGSAATRFGIGVQDALVGAGLLGFGLGAVVVFKGRPEAKVVEALRGDGFRIIELPKNPYTETKGE